MLDSNAGRSELEFIISHRSRLGFGSISRYRLEFVPSVVRLDFSCDRLEFAASRPLSSIIVKEEMKWKQDARSALNQATQACI